jgi:hypothetical protein
MPPAQDFSGTPTDMAVTQDMAQRSDFALPPGAVFRHPGILVNAEQLDWLKAKISAGAEPWTTAFNSLKSSQFAALDYQPAPVADVDCGAYSNPDHGCHAEQDDATAAYTQALLWYFTGNAAYAKTAISILNAWSSILQKHTNSNARLQAGWTGAMFPRAAEILRYTHAGWAQPDIDRFAKMLTNAHLPSVIHGAPTVNGNWDLTDIEAIFAIGVFLDDRALFDQAADMWRKSVPAYIYLKSDGPTPVPPRGGTNDIVAYWHGQSTFVDGLSQETCRDFGHMSLGFAAMINAAETARIQGLNLYAEEQKRIATGLEFNGQYLDGVPAPSWLCGGKLNLTPYPTWEIGYNEYVNRDGLSLPHTLHVLLKNRPSGHVHHIAWETLTHAGVGTIGIP